MSGDEMSRYLSIRLDNLKLRVLTRTAAGVKHV